MPAPELTPRNTPTQDRRVVPVRPIRDQDALPIRETGTARWDRKGPTAPLPLPQPPLALVGRQAHGHRCALTSTRTSANTCSASFRVANPAWEPWRRSPM